jgi:hypothetical protein
MTIRSKHIILPYGNYHRNFRALLAVNHKNASAMTYYGHGSMLCALIKHLVLGFMYMYEGKSISKLQMDIELKQIRVLI